MDVDKTKVVNFLLSLPDETLVYLQWLNYASSELFQCSGRYLKQTINTSQDCQLPIMRNEETGELWLFFSDEYQQLQDVRVISNPLQ